MRIAAITLALLCSTAIAEDKPWQPSDNGNLLWQKERQNQIDLTPSQAVTVFPGQTMYNDVDRGTWGTVSDIGGGQYLINEDGPDGSSLTIVNQQPNGGLMWTRN